MAKKRRNNPALMFDNDPRLNPAELYGMWGGQGIDSLRQNPSKAHHRSTKRPTAKQLAARAKFAAAARSGAFRHNPAELFGNDPRMNPALMFDNNPRMNPAEMFDARMNPAQLFATDMGDAVYHRHNPAEMFDNNPRMNPSKRRRGPSKPPTRAQLAARAKFAAAARSGAFRHNPAELFGNDPRMNPALMFDNNPRSNPALMFDNNPRSNPSKRGKKRRGHSLANAPRDAMGRLLPRHRY